MRDPLGFNQYGDNNLFQPSGWFEALNGSSEQVPAHGIVEVTGGAFFDTGSGGVEYYLTVNKPSGEDDRTFVSHNHVTRSGYITRFSRTYPQIALINTGEAAPASGDEWGPVSGQWYLASSGSGYVILHVLDETNGYALVTRKSGTAGAEIIRFTIDSADCDVTPKTASVNVDAIICSGASVAIDDTVTVYDNAGCLLDEPEADLAGRVGFAVKLLDSECQWEVLQMCCPTNQCS